MMMVTFGILKTFPLKRISLALTIGLGLLLTSCASVKGYERAYLNDEEMELSMRKCQELEAYFQIIREGASGANGGKTGGGCGCN
jgi:hypothetical protein